MFYKGNGGLALDLTEVGITVGASLNLAGIATALHGVAALEVCGTNAAIDMQKLVYLVEMSGSGGNNDKIINVPKSVERQAKKLSPEAKKGYDKAIEGLKSGDTRGLNDHPLSGDRAGERAVDIKGIGKGRGQGRVVYKVNSDGSIDIIDILTKHDY